MCCIVREAYFLARSWKGQDELKHEVRGGISYPCPLSDQIGRKLLMTLTVEFDSKLRYYRAAVTGPNPPEAPALKIIPPRRINDPWYGSTLFAHVQGCHCTNDSRADGEQRVRKIRERLRPPLLVTILYCSSLPNSRTPSLRATRVKGIDLKDAPFPLGQI